MSPVLPLQAERCLCRMRQRACPLLCIEVVQAKALACWPAAGCCAGIQAGLLKASDVVSVLGTPGYAASREDCGGL